MGGSKLTDYAKYLNSELPEEIGNSHEHFTIEISIVMRKPKGHFSRAPGVVLDILNTFEGGTFFQGQGFWRGVQEPIIYILISKQSNVKSMIESLLFQIQNFLKINLINKVGLLILDLHRKMFLAAKYLWFI